MKEEGEKKTSVKSTVRLQSKIKSQELMLFDPGLNVWISRFSINCDFDVMGPVCG